MDAKKEIANSRASTASTPDSNALNKNLHLFHCVEDDEMTPQQYLERCRNSSPPHG